ncbi:MAG: UvrD-helicase domain-containing protein [Clostridia bacterium]|nr:UvrD-helicase domain-containing protein [Clostridia bacterium]
MTNKSIEERRWTTAQMDAIASEGCSVLVSAAAGSGKTSTLTQRIISAILSGRTDISRMLIVTFTKAAANELRERIEGAVEKAAIINPELRRQQYLLESAKICTIHSFCLDIIRPYFNRLGLPARFRTLDDAEERVLKRSIMDELISDCYGKEWARICPSSGISFPEFADCFASDDIRDDSGMIDLFTGIFDRISGYRDREKIFSVTAENYRSSAESDPFAEGNPFGRVIKDDLLGFCRHYSNVFSIYRDIFASCGSKYLSAVISDIGICSALISAAEEGYDRARTVLYETSFEHLPPIKAKDRTAECDEYKEVRSQFKEYIKKNLQCSFSSGADGFRSDCAESAGYCRSLGAFMSEFSRRYDAAKRRLNAIDYSDMEHLAYRLLYSENGDRSETAVSLASGFDEIFIDEYQDVNEIQDLIFSALSNGSNRFMVGDIKQSIYAFRGAMPDIFTRYRRDFSAPGSSGKVIFMSENFRSDRSVIDFSNAVFDTVWKAAGDSMDYRDEDRLVCGREDTPQGIKPEIILIENGRQNDPEGPDKDEDPSAEPDEAEYVAMRIEELIRTGAKDDGTPILPGDIAILTRNSKDFSVRFEDALARRGIKTQNRERRQFFENPEILLMLCLLSAIDNPRQDIPLLGVMVSPVFGFTLDEVISIRNASGSGSLYDSVLGFLDGTVSGRDEGEAAANIARKAERLVSDLERYRVMAQGTPSDKLIFRLYRDCGIISLLQTGADGRTYESRRTNLLALHEYARNFESGGYRGLYSFISYINGLISTDTKVSSPESGEAGDDSVKIMTIHSSKGLEFPVCFVVGCGRRFIDSDLRSPIVFEQEMGIAINLRIKGHFAKKRTAAHMAVSAKLHDKAREEELRILYVAFTRARERLFVTACVRSAEKTSDRALLSRRTFGRHTVMNQNTYIDIVLGSLERFSLETGIPVSSVCRISEGASGTLSALPESVSDTTGTEADPVKTSEVKKMLKKRLDFEYPFRKTAGIPAKVSVSRLYPEILDRDDRAFEFGADGSYEIPALSAMPQFAGGESGLAAEAGTSTHVFMQFCDFGNLGEHGVDSELRRLLDNGFITGEMANLVRKDEIEKFVSSGLFSEIAAAKRIWREQKFTVFLDASMFSADPEIRSERLLVQGVIDCFFISDDGMLTLVDYKTDRLTSYELAHPEAAVRKLIERHSMQLEYYGTALEKIMGKYPDRVFIFSLCLGDAVEVPRPNRQAEN